MLKKILVFFPLLLIAFFLWAKKPAPNYITHKVVSGESLYGIAKKNDVTVDDILKSNPGVTAASLKPGMMLRIPSTKPTTKPADKPSTTSNSNKKQENHIVLANETLYSIAKKYGVTVEDLKAWNDLKDNSIKKGMVLLINPDKKTLKELKKDEPVKPVVTTPTVTAPPKQPEPATEEMPSDAQEENLSLSALIKQFGNQQKVGTPQTVKGTADLMASSSNSATTYFAMHKTAPIGTILKIKNLENSKVTYAKVIGKLPEIEENKNVMLRVSMGVAKAIGMGYGKVYVEMDYAQ